MGRFFPVFFGHWEGLLSPGLGRGGRRFGGGSDWCARMGEVSACFCEIRWDEKNAGCVTGVALTAAGVEAVVPTIRI